MTIFNNLAPREQKLADELNQAIRNSVARSFLKTTKEPEQSRFDSLQQALIVDPMVGLSPRMHLIKILLIHVSAMNELREADPSEKAKQILCVEDAVTESIHKILEVELPGDAEAAAADLEIREYMKEKKSKFEAAGHGDNCSCAGCSMGKLFVGLVKMAFKKEDKPTQSAASTSEATQ